MNMWWAGYPRCPSLCTTTMSLVGPRSPAPPARFLILSPHHLVAHPLPRPAAFEATRFYNVSARSPLAQELCAGPACNEVERAPAQGPGECAGHCLPYHQPPRPSSWSSDQSGEAGSPSRGGQLGKGRRTDLRQGSTLWGRGREGRGREVGRGGPRGLLGGRWEGAGPSGLWADSGRGRGQEGAGGGPNGL